MSDRSRMRLHFIRERGPMQVDGFAKTIKNDESRTSHERDREPSQRGKSAKSRLPGKPEISGAGLPAVVVDQAVAERNPR